MTDNGGYIDKKECIRRGYVRLEKYYYKMTALEKYLKKGWLAYGNKKYSGQDRYNAGMKLFLDYKLGGFESELSSAMGKIKVDCGGSHIPEDMLDIRQRYLAAIRGVPEEFWPAVRRVCIEDGELNAGDCPSERRRLEITYSLKHDLCRGLDRLIEFYRI